MTPLVQNVFDPKSAHDKSAAVAVASDASIMVAGVFPKESETVECRSSWDSDTRLQIRWLDSDAVICTLDYRGFTVARTQFSLDHTILASIYRYGCVRTWRVETGECLTLFGGHPSPWCISLSPDFKLICSAGGSKTISVWANDKIGTDQKPRKRRDSIMSVVSSSDRTLAATASYSGVVRVWDMGTCGCIHLFEDEFLKATMHLHDYPELFQFSEDSKHLFAYRIVSRGSSFRDTAPYLDGHLQVWDLSSGQRVISSQTRIHSTDSTGDFQGYAVSVAPDCRCIALVLDRIVTIIAVDTSCVTREIAITGPVHDVAFSPDSQSVFVLSSETSETRSRGTSCKSEELVVWKLNIAQADDIVRIRPPDSTRRILAVSSDERFLVLKTKKTYNVLAQAILTCTGELLYKFAIPNMECQVSLIENDSTLLVCDPNALTFRNPSNGQIIRSLSVELGSNHPRRLNFDPNSQQIHTNVGTITVPEHLKNEHQPIISLEQHLDGYGLSCDRSWLVWNNKKIFWLRPTFRPSGDVVEVCGSTVLIRADIKELLFFKFEVQDLLRVE